MVLHQDVSLSTPSQQIGYALSSDGMQRQTVQTEFIVQIQAHGGIVASHNTWSNSAVILSQQTTRP